MTAARPIPGNLPDVVVVTGTGSGLGGVTARLLREAGCAVIGVDLAPQDDQAGYQHVAGDVAADETWARVAELVDAHGAERLGLVCGAAILEVGDVLGLDLDVWRKTFEVNVIGAVQGFRTLLPRMIDRRDGSIVMIGSVSGNFAEQQLISYCTSKAAAIQLARTAALDHARENVRINIVSPGPMNAGLFARHMASADDPQKFYDTRAQRQPLGRIPEPEEVANAVLFLLSDAAYGLTGTQIMADGGLTAGFDFRTGAEGSSAG